MAFPLYLLRMALGGMAGGAAHGAYRGYRDLRRDVPVRELIEQTHIIKYIVQPAAHDGLVTSLLAPWAPIALPLWIFHWRDTGCPLHPNPNQRKE